MLYTFGILFILTLLIILFFNVNPEFGGIHLENRTIIYKESGLYKDGKFQNQVPTPMDMSISTLWSTLRDFLKPSNRVPKLALPSVKLTKESFIEGNKNKLIWLGHSSFYLQWDGLRILIDPMFGPTPAPNPLLGTSRFPTEPFFNPDDLPLIDLVLYSHDHYDHLDYKTVKRIQSKVKQFFVPLGIGAHLERWKVDKKKIQEFAWWDEMIVNNLKFTATPARHFSGRALLDRNATLWCSWVIQSADKQFYFSGDTGYGPHFKEIYQKFGDFDFALIECGQYDLRWHTIHLLPSETVLAAEELHANFFQPIHWGQFSLALHDWNEPAMESYRISVEKDVKIQIPMLGEDMNLFEYKESSKWWETQSN